MPSLPPAHRASAARLIGTAVLALAVLATAGCGTSRPVAGSSSVPHLRPVPAVPPAPRSLSDLPSGQATVWAVGDGADGKPAARGLAARITDAHPTLFLYLGDVYEAGTGAEYAAHYDPLYGAIAGRTAPTPGNHEYPRRASGYLPYWRKHLGGAVAPYYAVHVAGWTILSLNSEAPHDARSAQLRWLRRQAAGPGTCRIAFWHRPRFSAALHGDQPDVAPLWDTLQGHAALVLNGHDHTSQRLKPVGGVTEIVAGAGGPRPYPLDPSDSRLAFGATGTPTALQLRLRPGVARLAFRRSDDTVVDTAVIRCR